MPPNGGSLPQSPAGSPIVPGQVQDPSNNVADSGTQIIGGQGIAQTSDLGQETSSLGSAPDVFNQGHQVALTEDETDNDYFAKDPFEWSDRDEDEEEENK